MKRRTFIKLTAGVLTVGVLPSAELQAAAGRPALVKLSPLDKFAPEHTSHWLGPDLWGNRLQDWRAHNGRIECLRGERDFEVRTCSLITRQLNDAHKPARIRAEIGKLTPNKEGFCGFLLGIGQGNLDYRGAALAQRFSGEGGGFMAVIDSDGSLSFRDFTDAEQPLDYEAMTTLSSDSLGALENRNVVLDCHIDPADNELFDVRLTATDAKDGTILGFALRRGVPASELKGNVALVSSTPAKQEGARWWFSDIATGGKKFSVHPEHGLGPVMGCMYSLNRKVLKLSAQFMPIDLNEHTTSRLDFRIKGAKTWIKGPVSEIEDGFVALFRVDDWDYEKDWQYRVVFPEKPTKSLFEGRVPKDPNTQRPLNIALYSCITPTSRKLDDGHHQPFIPEERVAGRYTPENILFPHSDLVKNCDSHLPDLYVFCGDQYYETYPTRPGRQTKDGKLDTLYRWYLWYWAFRDSVRNRPSIMLADDHDILQGNLWGQEGKDSEKPKEEDGGYKWDKSLVRMVYRIQHGHNPDAYDPTPIKYDIPVTYGSFVYGGVNFAVIEDRKFKSAPDYDGDPTTKRGELLGTRQETFLKDWATTEPGLPKICLTASIWGSPQTEGNLKPLLDYDANGYPPDGRTRAVQLLKNAGALALAGDQHLGMVARQGINAPDDGPLFFAGPAASAFWQRWFEGEGKLSGQRNNNPNTGNFIDCFGNPMRVLAVANPRISHADFVDNKRGWGIFLADRALKSEGYGIVKVDHNEQKYILECWSWDEDPTTGKQFDGWPVIADFEWPTDSASQTDG